MVRYLASFDLDLPHFYLFGSTHRPPLVNSVNQSEIEFRDPQIDRNRRLIRQDFK